ncbi:hypothetical protein MINT15_31470 [Saccharomonospora viridis]|uniref:Uncharacterized protein n=1 Tax=Saccharomonospora viridis TaxID=1852 RepID=A0A837D6V4_9PSEU|nr:hypothetical protein MINT15_31470 [Saccharomonospora viridis]
MTTRIGHLVYCRVIGGSRRMVLHELRIRPSSNRKEPS